MHVYVCSSLVRFSLIWVSFEKLKSDYNQTWVKDAFKGDFFATYVIMQWWIEDFNHYIKIDVRDLKLQK